MEELLPDNSETPAGEQAGNAEDLALKSVVEAIIYVAAEPVTVDQIVKALEVGPQDPERASEARKNVARVIEQLREDYESDVRGIEVREIAGGYKMFTKPQHHDAVRRFVKSLTPPLRLSMAALETLATIAYRQPLTAPEISAVRGVQGTGVLKTLLDRKLINTAGRKNVIGKPILYKTTKEFLVQFGLGSLSDLPSMEEFEELIKSSLGESSEPTLPLDENADGSFSRNPDSIAQVEAGTIETGAAEADPAAEPTLESPVTESPVTESNDTQEPPADSESHAS